MLLLNYERNVKILLLQLITTYLAPTLREAAFHSILKYPCFQLIPQSIQVGEKMTHIYIIHIGIGFLKFPGFVFTYRDYVYRLRATYSSNHKKNTTSHTPTPHYHYHKHTPH